MPADDEAFALLEKLEDFFGGPDLTTAISDFAAAHGAEFPPLPAGAEHPLQWHTRYLEYCGMIERQLEGFLQQHGSKDLSKLATGLSRKNASAAVRRVGSSES